MAASIKLTVASHHYKVEPRTQEAKEMLFEFTRRFLKVDFQGNVRSITTFAAANKSRSWFRFHINSLTEFYMFARNRNYLKEQMEIVVRPYIELAKVDLPVKEHWEVRVDQVPIVDYLTKPIAADEPKAKLVGLQTGGGKLQPLTSKIKVPGGWRTMGDMCVGMPITAVDGSTTFVTGVHPQGKQTVYRVTFADGRSTLAGAEHLWKVYYVNTVPHRRWRVVNTVEMLRLISMPNPRVYVPLCDSEIIDETALPLDPYVLGLMLGNGGFSQKHTTYTTRDLETIDAIADRLPTGFTVQLKNVVNDNKLECTIVRSSLSNNPSGFNSLISTLGLQGCLSYTKFIPTIYLNGSTDQRWELLQGLLDSDGTIGGDNGHISYSSSSEKLALDVQYLVRSLGGIATITSRIPRYTHQGEKKLGARNYNVHIRLKTPSLAFKSERKKCRTNDNNQYSPDLKLRVTKVEMHGEEETQCISVAHPSSLYITDDFIVTHNTFTAIKSISDIGHKVAVVLKPKYIDKWVDDFTDETKGILDISEKEIMTIQGSAELMALTKLVEIPGALDKYKIFIFSNRTFDNYLKAYELLGSDITAMGYMIEPDYLFERMGVGIRLIDEVHEEFHANFRQDLYTHVHMSISLSATLISRDPTLMRMYETAYPQATRYKAPPLERYTTSYGVYYNSNPNYRLKTSERGQSSYSHTAYESCIMNNKTFMKGYGDMIKHYLDKGFVQNYEPGHKAIVFAATIDMCTRLKDHLSDAYPQFSVRRFVTGDDYHTDYQAPDIRVTTIGKGGTGLDIKNLTDAHMTNALDSIQQNIQAFGRLRNLLPKETRFFWYTNRRVPKHVKYHAKKMQLMKERALSVSNIDYMPQL